jgi:hypothetical protein
MEVILFATCFYDFRVAEEIFDKGLCLSSETNHSKEILLEFVMSFVEFMIIAGFRK